MADFIDREELLCVLYQDCHCMNTRFLNCVRQAPAINRWIPCSERMPKNEKPCAVVTETGGIGVSRMMGRNHYEWTLFGQRVTHWMPLPEPPEGGVTKS